MQRVRVPTELPFCMPPLLVGQQRQQQNSFFQRVGVFSPGQKVFEREGEEKGRGGPILTPLLCIMPFTGCPKVGRGGKTLLTLPAGLCGGWGGGGRLGSADHTQRRQGRREGGSLFSLLHFCVGGGKKCKKEGDCNFARSKGGGKHEEETERLLPFIDRDATGNRHGMTTTHPTTQKKSKVGLHLESR